MSIDLNTAGEQQTGSNLVIPPKSKVQVQLSIIYPDAGRAGSSAPELTRAHSGLEYLATKLTVTRGTFAGKVIYQNFNLANAQTTGQQKAVDISIRSIRAMVEASRGIRPKDNSPTATQARKLQRWSELDGLTCFIVVDCEQSQPSRSNGRVYINNRLYSVVTIDDPCYQQLTQQGEMISNDPIPEVQQTATAAPAPRPSWVAQQPASAASAPTPAWGQPAPTQQPATPLQTTAPTPSWGATPPPMAAAANTSDTVPF
jgi:hypothetical protein